MGLTEKLSQLQRQELNRLLDKYENRKDYGKAEKSPRRTFLHMTQKEYPDYYHISDSQFRLDYNAEMEHLAELGLVELFWKKFEEGECLEKIALNEDKVDVIYQILQRKPKVDQFRDMKQIFLDYQQEAPEGLNTFYCSILDKLEHLEKLPAQVNWEHLNQLAEFLNGLNRLAKSEGQEEIPRRQFSVELYGDTKRWEKLYEKRAVWVLRNYWSASDGEGTDSLESLEEGELLSEFGVVENPLPVNVRGDLKFVTPSGEVDLSLFYPDVGLSPRMIQDMEITGLDVDAVVTIENLTSFYHYISAAPRSHLVIYLGGYHNRMRRRILSKLWEYNQRYDLNIGFYHWGDIDLGGFRIFSHLKEKTQIPFKPLMMDENTYLKHLDLGHGFDDHYGKKLARLLKDEHYSEFHTLIRMMLEKKKIVEQEAVQEMNFTT